MKKKHTNGLNLNFQYPKWELSFVLRQHTRKLFVIQGLNETKILSKSVEEVEEKKFSFQYAKDDV